MKQLIFILIAFLTVNNVYAKAAFSGIDYSGVYDCTGEDFKEGNYKGTVTLKLNPEQSSEKYGAYSFQLDAQGYGIYEGQAAQNGDTMAMHFALNKPKTDDFGTGIANFKKTESGKYTFHKFYYEPKYKGGNHGVEECKQRQP